MKALYLWITKLYWVICF